jgi:signal transduction histidine kinase
VDEVIDIMEFQAKEKGIQIIKKVIIKNNLQMQSDSKRIKQVLLNLV